jgi:hypothetical protein
VREIDHHRLDYPLTQAMKLAFDRASGADGFYG